MPQDLLPPPTRRLYNEISKILEQGKTDAWERTFCISILRILTYGYQLTPKQLKIVAKLSPISAEDYKEDIKSEKAVKKQPSSDHAPYFHEKGYKPPF